MAVMKKISMAPYVLSGIRVFDGDNFTSDQLVAVREKLIGMSVVKFIGQIRSVYLNERGEAMIRFLGVEGKEFTVECQIGKAAFMEQFDDMEVFQFPIDFFKAGDNM